MLVMIVSTQQCGALRIHVGEGEFDTMVGITNFVFGKPFRGLNASPRYLRSEMP